MNIAVLGATGVVGQEILCVLEQRDFPVTSLSPLASARSAASVTFRGKDVEVAGRSPTASQGSISCWRAGAPSPRPPPSGRAAHPDRQLQRVPHGPERPRGPESTATAPKGIIANPNCVRSSSRASRPSIVRSASADCRHVSVRAVPAARCRSAVADEGPSRAEPRRRRSIRSRSTSSRTTPPSAPRATTARRRKGMMAKRARSSRIPISRSRHLRARAGARAH